MMKASDGPMPSAPPADPGVPHHGPAPPTYNEAMGWNPPAAQPPITGHRPMTHVTANPMAAPQPTVQPIVIVQQQMPPSGPVVMVGAKATKLDCPVCHAHIKTTTVTTNKLTSHMCALVLCLIGCWPCFWIPYCMEGCKQVTHICPNCKSILGVYNG